MHQPPHDLVQSPTLTDDLSLLSVSEDSTSTFPSLTALGMRQSLLTAAKGKVTDLPTGCNGIIEEGFRHYICLSYQVSTCPILRVDATGLA